MTLADLENQPSLLLLKCISGSRAYGLHTPTSDTDLKGVFWLPKNEWYGLTYTDQVSNETNDEVYYELKRFFELLVKNNPNILELLATPDDCLIYRHPLMQLIKVEDFLSKLCKESFAGYALTQIKKARGLHKKILNPMEGERKSLLDFCYVIHQQGSIPLHTWLEKNNYHQEDCGLVNIPHIRQMYALFHTHQLEQGFLMGISSGPESNDVVLSSVPASIQPLATMSFNKDAYSSHCKDYREYQEWVQKRNIHRYHGTLSHGKNYDAKNMMHTFRLLHMAEEIAREGKIYVRRIDRDFLLKIRSGEFEYEELVNRVDEKIQLIHELFTHADLPETPNIEKAEALLIQCRETLYG
jgi:hypothetical protein